MGAFSETLLSRTAVRSKLQGAGHVFCIPLFHALDKFRDGRFCFLGLQVRTQALPPHCHDFWVPSIRAQDARTARVRFGTTGIEGKLEFDLPFSRAGKWPLVERPLVSLVSHLGAPVATGTLIPGV